MSEEAQPQVADLHNDDHSRRVTIRQIHGGKRLGVRQYQKGRTWWYAAGADNIVEALRIAEAWLNGGPGEGVISNG